VLEPKKKKHARMQGASSSALGPGTLNPLPLCILRVRMCVCVRVRVRVVCAYAEKN
jgi:hypothetical protein